MEPSGCRWDLECIQTIEYALRQEKDEKGKAWAWKNKKKKLRKDCAVLNDFSQ